MKALPLALSIMPFKRLGMPLQVKRDLPAVLPQPGNIRFGCGRLHIDILADVVFFEPRQRRLVLRIHAHNQRRVSPRDNR